MDISNLTSLINALRAERMFLVAHKKKDIAFSAMSLCSLGITHKKKTLLFSDVSFVRLGLLTKKRHCFSAMSLLGARWDSNP